MFKGKKVTIMGLGLLGRGVGDAIFLAQEGAELIITDLKTEEELKDSLKKLENFKNIKYTLGRHDFRDFEDRDFILKAAGVPLDSPYIAHAEKQGVEVLMSTALFAKLSPARIVGITGTRGKTTVTRMLHEILKIRYAGTKKQVFLGGNIQGMSTLPLVRKAKKGDIAILELDSWQLQGFGELGISPSVAIFTTFMPDHLNYYKNDLSKYFADKANIFKFQKSNDLLFTGEQIKTSPKFYDKFPKRANFVSGKNLPKDIKLQIPGEHNAYNAGLAYSAARGMGISLKVIKKGLESFRGVPGRLEKIRVYREVEIYNDTTATTPDALATALVALGRGKNILLIAGGADKGIDLKVLTKSFFAYAKHVVLLSGSGTERLIREKIIPTGISYSVHKGIKSAVREAVKYAEKGDIILLSPGFASFGMFKNEYDRGEQFSHIISALA